MLRVAAVKFADALSDAGTVSPTPFDSSGTEWAVAECRPYLWQWRNLAGLAAVCQRVAVAAFLA
jgi:hypothetical protein